MCPLNTHIRNLHLQQNVDETIYLDYSGVWTDLRAPWLIPETKGDE